jgi:hypothetical protein
MARRACLDCARRCPPGRTRCERCDGGGGGWSHNRDQAAQAAFRKALIARADGRCEEVDELTGERCTETDDLRACHLVPLSEGGGYDPSEGKLRCRRHDRMTDPHAR